MAGRDDGDNENMSLLGSIKTKVYETLGEHSDGEEGSLRPGESLTGKKMTRWKSFKERHPSAARVATSTGKAVTWPFRLPAAFPVLVTQFLVFVIYFVVLLTKSRAAVTAMASDDEWKAVVGFDTDHGKNIPQMACNAAPGYALEHVIADSWEWMLGTGLYLIGHTAVVGLREYRQLKGASWSDKKRHITSPIAIGTLLLPLPFLNIAYWYSYFSLPGAVDRLVQIIRWAASPSGNSGEHPPYGGFVPPLPKDSPLPEILARMDLFGNYGSLFIGFILTFFTAIVGVMAWKGWVNQREIARLTAELDVLKRARPEAVPAAEPLMMDYAREFALPGFVGEIARSVGLRGSSFGEESDVSFDVVTNVDSDDVVTNVDSDVECDTLGGGGGSGLADHADSVPVPVGQDFVQRFANALVARVEGGGGGGGGEVTPETLMAEAVVIAANPQYPEAEKCDVVRDLILFSEARRAQLARQQVADTGAGAATAGAADDGGTSLRAAALAVGQAVQAMSTAMKRDVVRPPPQGVLPRGAEVAMADLIGATPLEAHAQAGLGALNHPLLISIGQTSDLGRALVNAKACFIFVVNDRPEDVSVRALQCAQSLMIAASAVAAPPPTSGAGGAGNTELLAACQAIADSLNDLARLAVIPVNSGEEGSRGGISGIVLPDSLGFPAAGGPVTGDAAVSRLLEIDRGQMETQKKAQRLPDADAVKILAKSISIWKEQLKTFFVNQQQFPHFSFWFELITKLSSVCNNVAYGREATTSLSQLVEMQAYLAILTPISSCMVADLARFHIAEPIMVLVTVMDQRCHRLSAEIQPKLARSSEAVQSKIEQLNREAIAKAQETVADELRQRDISRELCEQVGAIRRLVNSLSSIQATEENTQAILTELKLLQISIAHEPQRARLYAMSSILYKLQTMVLAIQATAMPALSSASRGAAAGISRVEELFVGERESSLGGGGGGDGEWPVATVSVRGSGGGGSGSDDDALPFPSPAFSAAGAGGGAEFFAKGRGGRGRGVSGSHDAGRGASVAGLYAPKRTGVKTYHRDLGRYRNPALGEDHTFDSMRDFFSQKARDDDAAVATDRGRGRGALGRGRP